MRWRLADTSARHLEAHSAGLYWTLRPSSSSQSSSASSQSISSGLSSTWASSQSASFVFTTLVLVKMINKTQLQDQDSLNQLQPDQIQRGCLRKLLKEEILRHHKTRDINFPECISLLGFSRFEIAKINFCRFPYLGAGNGNGSQKIHGVGFFHFYTHCQAHSIPMEPIKRPRAQFAEQDLPLERGKAHLKIVL